MVEYESIVGNLNGKWHYPDVIQIESDYAFDGMVPNEADKTTYWVPDPQYKTQVNYDCIAPLMLECRPPIGPDMIISPGCSLESFRIFELIHDSSERERRSLAMRRMYRTIAPWVTENPSLLHVRDSNPEVVRAAIDQCADAGFEMVILSFGSGFNIESEDPEYIKSMKELADYAHGRGVEIGGYSLLASRSISREDDVVSHEGTRFGQSPCIGSRWGEEYFKKLENFFIKTGMDLLEHDGSYPGDICESTAHPGHKGRGDSQWTQWRKITNFYKWCRSRGIYLNVPDWYYLSGSSKNGMGYKEVDWSLPRERQIIIARQNIYDGTWYKTPSMGWMFVPLTEYHGGGAAATIEPLCEHLDTYEAHLMNNFASGVQACYRGTRLYDTEETRLLVKKVVGFYKKYRSILDSDIIHVRRPDGRDIDCMLHVNPSLDIKGLAVVYNPLDVKVSKTLRLPLYYTGITETALVSEMEGEEREYKLDREYNIELEVNIEPASAAWYLIR